jgi:hypothetical protein
MINDAVGCSLISAELHTEAETQRTWQQQRFCAEILTLYLSNARHVNYYCADPFGTNIWILNSVRK